MLKKKKKVKMLNYFALCLGCQIMLWTLIRYLRLKIS